MKGFSPVGYAAASIFVIAVAVSNAPQLANAQPFNRARKQPTNTVITARLDSPGGPRLVSVSQLPEENFHSGLILKKPQEQIRKPPAENVHPVLREWMKRNVLSTEAEVIVTFREDLTIPDFPRLKSGEPRNSPDNQIALADTAALVDSLGQARKASHAQLIQKLQALGLVVEEQYWLINGVLATAPLGSVEAIAAQPEVLYVQPRLAGEPPPANDVVDGRNQIQSDAYFNNITSPTAYIGVLDTGIRPTHTLFQAPSNVNEFRDCVNGGAMCENIGGTYDPSDNYWNHGTSTVAIITGNNNLGNRFRGVTRNVVDSFKVYVNAGLDSAAAIRGFQASVALRDSIVVAEMQASETPTGAIATAAENAYDSGLVVVAANGNFGPRAGSVGSPAIARKVIGVGAYDVQTLATPDYQSRGPTPDGRIKPDFQTPTNVNTASNSSDTALRRFTGTSCATPFASGAAALALEWLNILSPDGIDNGQVYAYLVASGQQPFDFDNTTGAGKLKLLLGGSVMFGSVDVNTGETIDIPFTVNPDDRRVDAALWWPEYAGLEHNNVDLWVLDPDGVVRASSTSIPSVFERARVDGSPLAAGSWKLQIEGVNVPSGPQQVYFIVHYGHAEDELSGLPADAGSVAIRQ